MRRTGTALLALSFAGIASGALAQTGDPDRTRQQEALAHAVAIQNAWAGTEARIRVTDAADLWEDEWTGLTAPPSGSWWLWTERGLTARYCDGVLAVYAATDELKGLGRDHREVQVAPARYGDGRTGLHVILANTRIAQGAHGRDDTALPACMSIPSTGEDRVGLVGRVADPIRTVTGIRWETETRDVACPGSTTDTFREARQVPIQITDILGSSETEGRDLSVTAPGVSHLWPRDCALRAALGAACSPWRHAEGLCPFQYAEAAPPEAIPDPVIVWRPAPVHRTTASCGCPSGYTGSCTLHYEQNTEYRDFRVRPGAPVVTTRLPARVNGSRRFVRRTDSCTPIPDPPVNPSPQNPSPQNPQNPTPQTPQNPQNPTPRTPSQTGGGENDGGGGESGDDGGGHGDGESGDDGGGSTGGNTDSTDGGVAEDDSDNEGFGGSAMGPPGSMGDEDTPGVSESGDGGGGGGGGGKPIVLDLDGDGVELVALERSTAFFDINGDGYRERMAWVSADDGFLAYDKDGDGLITAHERKQPGYENQC
ncbi:MAG: hypothetical protein OXE76_15080, partial [Alphaproteobacteria bacterium]|nr:hypothetical protein [Alphaproteobacteria bacterium]